MEITVWIFLSLSFFWLSRETNQINWLMLKTMTSNKLWSTSNICRKLKFHGFTKTQIDMCLKSTEIMPHVAVASHIVMETCQRVFIDRRWNCSSLQTAPNFTSDLTKGTREQAFVYALASASMAFYVSRACSSGRIFSCGCGVTPRERSDGEFQWGGCSDNIRFGIRFTRNFLNEGKRKRIRKQLIFSSKTDRLILILTNDHNNRVGRRILEASLKLQCKCHGVSGSCSIQTCWYGLHSIIDIGNRLKNKYATAVEATTKTVGGSLQMFRANSFMEKFSNDDLIFVKKSPDYCTENEKYGSKGTKGRFCNATSYGHAGCLSMCCGRGYMTYMIKSKQKCNCKYHWCCHVTCQECQVKKNIYVCK